MKSTYNSLINSINGTHSVRSESTASRNRRQVQHTKQPTNKILLFKIEMILFLLMMSFSVMPLINILYYILLFNNASHDEEVDFVEVELMLLKFSVCVIGLSCFIIDLIYSYLLLCFALF